MLIAPEATLPLAETISPRPARPDARQRSRRSWSGKRGRRSTWWPGRRSGRGWCAAAPRTTCWSSPPTTSSATAGRPTCCCARPRRCMPPAGTAGRRCRRRPPSPRMRWRSARAPRMRRKPTGSASSPPARRRSSCRPTGRGRRSRASAARRAGPGSTPRSSPRCGRPARSRAARLFVTLLAGVQVLLGAPTPGRTTSSSARAGRPGPSGWRPRRSSGSLRATSLPLRAALGPAGTTLGRLTGALQRACSTRTTHPQLPFEKLVAKLELPRDAGRLPVCWRAVQPRPPSTLPGARRPAGRRRRGTARPQFDLYSERCRAAGAGSRSRRLQHRPVRRRDGATAGSATAQRCSRRWRRPDDPDRGGCRCSTARRTAPAAGRLERQRRAVSPDAPLRRAHRRAGRAARPTPSPSVCGDAELHLRRARPPRATHRRTVCARRGSAPRHAGRRLRRALARHAGRLLGVLKRRAAPTCRSTPTIRRSGWPSCVDDAGSRRC